MSAAPNEDTHEAAEQSDGAAVLRCLKEKELSGLMDRLRLLAARKYYGSLDVDDLVTRAVIDTLKGARTWNSNCSPFRNLWFIVRSIAFNQLKKDGRMATRELDAEEHPERAEALLPSYPSAAEIYKTNEAQRDLRDLIGRAVGEDGLLRWAVAFFFEREVWKPKVMSDESGVSVEEIYEAKRRLRRRLERLLNKS